MRRTLIITALILIPILAFASGADYSYLIFSQKTGTTAAVTGDAVYLPATIDNIFCEITTYPSNTTSVSIYGGGGVVSNATLTTGNTAVMSLASTIGQTYSRVSTTQPMRVFIPVVTTPTVTTSTVNVLCIGK